MTQDVDLDNLAASIAEKLENMTPEDLIGKALIMPGLSMEQAKELARVIAEYYGVHATVITAGELADMMEAEQQALKGKERSNIIEGSKYQN